MQRPLQINFKDIPHSDAVERHIREKVEKLELFYPRMTGCRVTVELPHKHHHQGKRYNVRLDLMVPGNTVAVNRDLHEDIYVALRDTFDAARRRLEDYGRQQRGDVKTHGELAYGRIVRLFLDEGFGFIETADAREFYFNDDNVTNPRFDQLAVGAEVQFLEDASGEGLQAKRVSVGRYSPALA